MANGTIKSITPNGSEFSVEVDIPTAALGQITLTIDVPGPIGDAPEQARRKLQELGMELARSFDYPSGLA